MKRKNDWQRSAMRQFLFGISTVTVVVGLFGCSPPNSPMPQEEVPVPQEEPVTPP